MTMVMARGERHADVVIICFGFEHDRVRRQPWHVADGMARGLSELGQSVVLVTDATSPPRPPSYRVISVNRLLLRGRPTVELDAWIARLNPSRVLMITGAWQLVRMRALGWRALVTLVMASPRLTIKELTAPGLETFWRERALLTLPLLNALLPAVLLRAGYRRSGAENIAYLSRETQERYVALGLPAGYHLRPQVKPFVTHLEPVPSGAASSVCYLGPPLALRGAYLALEAFEQAVRIGLQSRLLLVIRPDADEQVTQNFMDRLEQSPVRNLIDCVTGMLDEDALRRLVQHCVAFIFPFQAPVSEVPLVVLEAALSGRPVVTLAAPGVTEYSLELGGIVVDDPRQLSHALLHAARRRNIRPPDLTHWQGWRKAMEPFVPQRRRALADHRMICLCGVDGSGKTYLLRYLQEELDHRGLDHRHVWTRFRNYLSKPLLALCLLTGHNRKERVDGVTIGYHDFQGRPWIAWPFVILQTIDSLIDLLWRYRFRGRGLVVGDRCVIDTLVDLAVDTGLDDLVIERLGPHLAGRLPAPRLVVLIRRNPRLVRKSRPDALADRHFARRRALYDRLARIYGLPVIENNGTPQQAVAAILGLVEDAEPNNRGEARDLRILQQ